MDTLLHVLELEPEPPRSLNPEVSRDLETICLKCLEKDPARRYDSAEMLAEDLDHWLRGEPIAARPAGLAEKGVKWVRRRPVVAALLAAVFLVTVLGIGAFAWSYGETLQARDSAVAALQETEKARKQEEEQRKIAENARQQAVVASNQKEKQLLRAESLLYIMQYKAAHDAFLNHDPIKSRTAIDECRWDFRGPEYGYLAKRLQKTMHVLHGHASPVNSLALSADGKRLCSGSDDTAIKVWDLEAGKETLTLRGHTGPVNCLVLSGDGKRLYSGSEGASIFNVDRTHDNTIRVWDLQTGKEILTLHGHASGVTSLALSGDGKRLCSGSWDKTIKVWDLQTGKEALTLRGHTSGVTGLALSADGKRLFSGGREKYPWKGDTTIKVWDLEMGKEVLTLRGHDQASPLPGIERRRQATVLGECGPDDQGVGRGDGPGNPHPARTRQCGRSLALSHDGKRLFSAGGTPAADGAIKVWDVETGKETLSLHARATHRAGIEPGVERRR